LIIREISRPILYRIETILSFLRHFGMLCAAAAFAVK